MPPTKRARLEEDTPDEDMSSGGSTPSPPTWGVEIDEAACDGRCCAADYEKMASDRVDVDLGENNIDGQNNGIASCHVCSADAPSGPAAATTTSLDVRRGGRVGGAPGGPRSRRIPTTGRKCPITAPRRRLRQTAASGRRRIPFQHRRTACPPAGIATSRRVPRARGDARCAIADSASSAPR